ncbi:APC family permease [Sphingomonas sp. AR_OL41]|uniref:APC family permease n=1 Tax=Sphingomonas sp. AR_OL41 TaxID=3042729 RepID=UPI0024816AED|nr:APC family permease [Sphingomonas sp. AR_OL41]MDH7975239.1 APC family permease [Sphingomonas sp. AR_OL41]
MTNVTAPPLQRVLGPIGVTMLTLSVLSPGASVLVAGADILHQAGTGAALAFLLGGLLTLIFTFAQAELGSSFPLAGGDYATIGNTLGPRAGFVQFGVNLLQTPVFIAVSATGVGLYLHVLAPGLPALGIALAALALAAAIALLNIRTGALLTGTFLVVELGALALIALLGFMHPVQSLGAVFTAPLAFAGGAPTHLTLAGMGLAVAAASWATSGAGQAIYFSEEMHAPASVGRLVIAIVMMTILFEFVPVLGIVIGTEHLPSVFSSDAPFTAFLAERASPLIATLVTIGVIAALFNALVSGITCYGRFLYSSGRDRIWSAPINRALVRIHARFGSPWIATLVVALSAVACCFLGLSRLIVLASGCGIAQWVLLNMAGIVGRRRGLTGGPGTYRAPLFPLTHIISLIGAATLAIIAWQDVASGRPGVIAVATVILLSLLYHRFVLDRRGARWTMVSAAADATA